MILSLWDVILKISFEVILLCPAIVNESKNYTGDMDEKNYKMAKKAGKAAQIVGGTANVFGGKNEKNAGGLLFLGGATTDAVIGEGYKIEMQFRCI